MKNVLILGAGGQIARHVINQLADKQTMALLNKSDFG